MPVSLEAEDWKDFTGIPANIGYSAWGNNLGRLGMIPEGGLRVMANIVTYSYLWNEIRVKGGAYGCGCSTGPAGDVICYSYRDPSPSSSLDVFRGIPDFIRRFSEGDEEMDQYIISTLASAYPLRSDRGRGHVADIDVFRGMTGEMKKKEIGQILSVKKDDMYRYAQMFDVLSASSFEAVVGPENMRPEGFSDI